MRLGLLQFVCLMAVLLAFAGPAAAGPPGGERKSFKLPHLFDFGHFKSLFEKHYGSAMEELARQKIYLGRAFRAFISMVQYRYFKQDTYLSINVRSDETLEERRRRRMVQSSEFNLGEQPLADLRSIKSELVDMADKSSSSGYREILVELERAGGRSRVKREAGEGVREISLNQLIGPPRLPEMSTKISARVASNNPQYEPPELSSSAPGGRVAPPLQGDGRPPREPWDGMLARLDNWAPARYIKDVVALAIQGFQRPPTGASVEPDEVRADLRTTNCLFGARDQGTCASCYAFMTVALYEYLYCRATGKLVPFSEQYMVDCGGRTGLAGCAGGSMARSSIFVHHFGLELRNNYPYVARQEPCAYGQDTRAAKMGYIRPDADADYEEIQLKYFDQYLEAGWPIAFSLSLNRDFEDYGGGVDDLRDCRRELGHGMLIVGHGRQDGQEYYLLRNSYSVSWGEQGYYKLAKRAAWLCSLDGAGMAIVGGFGANVQGDRKNQERSSEQVEQRYGERLARFKEEQFAEMLENLLEERAGNDPAPSLPVAPPSDHLEMADLKSA